MTGMEQQPRTRDELLMQLARRAPYYTPEWRYNPDAADAGAALALIWADMFGGTLERFARLPDNFRRTFLDAAGSEARPPLRARGYLVFEPLPDTRDAVELPAGTAVAAPGTAAVLETLQNLTVSPARVEAVYCADPELDAVQCCDALEELTLFRNEIMGSHIWTLTHPYAFDVSDAAMLELEISLRGGNTAELLCAMTWEFADGGGWRAFDRAVMERDRIRLVFPANRETPCRSIRFILCGEAFRGIVLSGVRAFPAGAPLFPDAVYSDGTQQIESSFYPFGRRFLPGHCFYIACDDALSKPGAEVTLSLDVSFEPFAIEGYPAPQIRWKKLMREEDLLPPEEYEIVISGMAWEYFNGIGWASLPVTEGSDAICEAGSRRTLRFICPGDVSPAVCGADDRCFIRVRILTVDNLFRMHGHYKTPRLSNPRFTYEYPEGITVTRAVVEENLDSREVSLHTAQDLAGCLVGPRAVYLAFSRPFTQGSMLFVLAEQLQAPPLRWEYLSSNGWTPLDLYDGTNHLSETGCVVYQTPIPCVKARIMGRDAWWMRLCDAENAYTDRKRRPPRLVKLYENAVAAAAREPGENANLAARSFTALTIPIAGIAGVFNPLSSYGGVAAEDEAHIIKRITAGFSHGGRAVGLSDYERLALEASSRICRARCYPNTDTDGKPSREDICIVILPRKAEAGGFKQLEAEVGAFLETRRVLGSGKLHVVLPRYIAVDVELRAVIASPGEAMAVKRRLQDVLARFLDPVHGGREGRGWEIGGLPSPGAIALMLRETPRIPWIYGVQASYQRGGAACGYARANLEPFALPVNGVHEFILESAGEA